MPFSHTTDPFRVELLVAYKMSEHGVTPSVPLVPCCYDLVMDCAGKLFRIQVKNARWQEQRVRPKGKGERSGFYVQLVKGDTGRRKRIRLDEFDYLAVVCTPDEIYVIPMAALASKDIPGCTIREVRIKSEDSSRADAKKATERWQPYLNRFRLASPTGKP